MVSNIISIDTQKKSTNRSYS